MPTLEQIRAARALLGWNQTDLAERADLSQTGIARIENSTNHPNTHTLKKIEDAFEQADIEFIGDSGVKKRTGEVKILKGPDAMSHFLDDVHSTAITHGTKENPTEVFLSNVVHNNWIKWMGEERWTNHKNRMVKDKARMDVRIIVEENDTNFPAQTYSKYKWMPKGLFNEKSFYSYHDRLAFLDFGEKEVQIFVMQQYNFAKGYRDLFRVAWDTVCKEPNEN